MLPKINRLTKKKDFDLVFQKGKGAKIGHFVFRTVKNSLTKSRFGFIVSKKVSNKATIRNKTKRRLRAAASQIKLKNPSDIVIVALSGAEKIGFVEIKKTIADFLQKYNNEK